MAEGCTIWDVLGASGGVGVAGRWKDERGGDFFFPGFGAGEGWGGNRGKESLGAGRKMGPRVVRLWGSKRVFSVKLPLS